MKRFEEVALELVSEWFRTVQRKTVALTEEDLDDAVDDTFPASDPIAVTSYRERVDALKSIDVVVTPASISFSVPLGVLESASQGADEASTAHQEIECATLSGRPLTLHVGVAKTRPESIAIDIQQEVSSVAEAAARA